MAVDEYDKEQIEVNQIGRVRLVKHYVASSRSEMLRDAPVVVEGLVRTSLRTTPWRGSNGEYLADAVYEGLTDDPDPDLDEYDLYTEERETKIETFPDQEYLAEEFLAYSDLETKTLKFPATLPKPASRLGQPLTLSSQGNARETPNPLYNCTSYGVPYTVATWRLMRLKVPANLEKQARTVIDKLPSGFDYRGKKTQWYVRPLQKRKIGNAWEIEWQAFEVAEFADLQVLLALQGRSGRESGLTTGSL